MHVIACIRINLSTSDYHLFLAGRSVIATELEDFFPPGFFPPDSGLSGWKGPEESSLQSPAQDKLSNELRPGCLGMYPDGSGKSPRMDPAQSLCSAAWLSSGRKSSPPLVGPLVLKSRSYP